MPWHAICSNGICLVTYVAWKEQPLANSDENAKYKVIDLMSDQVDVDKRRYNAPRVSIHAKWKPVRKLTKLMAKI